HPALPSFPTRRSSDLRRPGPEDHADRQPGHPAVVACAVDQGYTNLLGHLLPDRHPADAADPAGDPERPGPAPGLNEGTNMDKLPDRKSTRLNSSHDQT